LKLDAVSHKLVSATADNLNVRTDGLGDQEQTALITPYDEAAKPLANRVVGKITADLTRQATQAGESALGDIIADAQLAATSTEDNGAAIIAFTNATSRLPHRAARSHLRHARCHAVQIGAHEREHPLGGGGAHLTGP
jgi:2',3'-cyclic-nucleotide 2'-phosphodiesterase (5'-nucleotidase family)